MAERQWDIECDIRPPRPRLDRTEPISVQKWDIRF